MTLQAKTGSTAL